jgi:hypothetical protein
MPWKEPMYRIVKRRRNLWKDKQEIKKIGKYQKKEAE